MHSSNTYHISTGGVEMNFMEAVKAMREGKMVRRKDWNAHQPSMCIISGKPWWVEDKVEIPIDVFLSHVEDSIYWGIAEEKKTLSDKIWLGGLFLEDDVKEALKEFVVWLEDYCVIEDYDKKFPTFKAKAIFGDKLLK